MKSFCMHFISEFAFNSCIFTLMKLFVYNFFMFQKFLEQTYMCFFLYISQIQIDMYVQCRKGKIRTDFFISLFKFNMNDEYKICK